MKVNMGRYPKGSGSRKISVTIEGHDLWSFDHTLAYIIYPALLQFKAQKNGVPSEFAMVGGEDYVDQQSFDFYTETNSEAFDLKVKEWDEVLDKMIWSFEQILKDDYSEKYHHGKAEYDWVESDHTYTDPVTGKTSNTFQMVDKNPDEHWYDHEGHMLHEERIQEGLELFGKYYRNLWI